MRDHRHDERFEEPRDSDDDAAAGAGAQRNDAGVESIAGAVFGFSPSAREATDASHLGDDAPQLRPDAVAPGGSEGQRGPSFLLPTFIALIGLGMAYLGDVGVVRLALGWLSATVAFVFASIILAMRMRHTNGPLSHADTRAATLTLVAIFHCIVACAVPLAYALAEL